VDYLLANKTSAEFLVAVEGAQAAESIIIATGQPVMALRGFSGSDPWPTLAKFQELVTAGKVRYLLVGGGSPAGSSGAGAGDAYSDIEQWVAQHGTVVPPSKYAGVSQGSTLYQLW
jgi:4-amino-4-deoxy-L-arabinose transferase-like glycosyltransferase